jgi:hypothetical protein
MSIRNQFPHSFKASLLHFGEDFADLRRRQVLVLGLGKRGGKAVGQYCCRLNGCITSVTRDRFKLKAVSNRMSMAKFAITLWAAFQIVMILPKYHLRNAYSGSAVKVDETLFL